MCFSLLGLVLCIGALCQTAVLPHPRATQVHEGGPGSGWGGLPAHHLLPECQGHSWHLQGLCPSPAPHPRPCLSSSESSWWFLISLLVSILIPLSLFFLSLILIPLKSGLERWRSVSTSLGVWDRLVRGTVKKVLRERGQQTTSRMKDHLLSSSGQGQGWGVGRVYGRETVDKIPQNVCCQAHCVHALPPDCHLRILGGDRMKNPQPRVGMSSLAHHPEPLARLLSMLTLPRLEPPGVGETPSGHVLQWLESFHFRCFLID